LSGSIGSSGSIRAHQLGKKYKRYRSHWSRLLEWMSWGRLQTHEELWALQGISFQVKPGEALGIVGQNGAGKSTLLKLLVGTTRPSQGHFEIDGDVAALLELGMGFHPEFTGEQNALMSLQMMGRSQPEAVDLLAEIAEFSELEEFLTQPLRTYSSGMQVRLGFAVATAKRPDLLIVDEALSVGDAYFQHKCIRRIRDFKRRGTAMLFVSHDPTAVKSLCDRALLLDGGVLVREGSAESILDYYNGMIAQREKDHSPEQTAINERRLQTRSGDGKAKIIDVRMADPLGRQVTSFTTGESVTIVCRIQFAEDLEDYTVGILIRDRLGNEVFGANTSFLEVPTSPGRAGDEVEASFNLDLNLGYGHYALTVAVHAPGGHLEQNHDWIDNVMSFQVIPGETYRFAGVVNLPVRAEINVRRP
jgi:lipopolysaccharide transport system ATP-binding protein